MKKRGQFYIIGAIIIVIIILGLVGVKNTITSKQEPVAFYDLGSNLLVEGSKIIDYGIYNQGNIDEIIRNFTDLFVDYASKNKQEDFDLTIIQGDNESVDITTYSKASEGEIFAFIGEEPFTITPKENFVPVTQNLNPGEGKIKLKLLENEYNFDIKSNENFYFIMTKDEEFEKYIIENS